MTYGSPSLKKLIDDFYNFSLKGSAPSSSNKPYAGAQPHMRPQPEILSEEECDRRTNVVLKALIGRINDATADGGVGVQVRMIDKINYDCCAELNGTKHLGTELINNFLIQILNIFRIILVVDFVAYAWEYCSQRGIAIELVGLAHNRQGFGRWQQEAQDLAFSRRSNCSNNSTHWDPVHHTEQGRL